MKLLLMMAISTQVLLDPHSLRSLHEQIKPNTTDNS